MRPLTRPAPPTALAAAAEERARQQSAFERVRQVLTARWPAARVHLFGSVASGLSVRSNNDLDVCLEMEGVGDDQVGAGGKGSGRTLAWPTLGARGCAAFWGSALYDLYAQSAA